MSLLNNTWMMNWINSLQINMVDSGYAALGSEWRRDNVCSPYTRVYYIHHGEGYALFGGEKQLLRQGHMYLIPIGFQYAYGCDAHMDQLFFHVVIPQPNGRDLFAQCSRCFELPCPQREIDRLVKLYRSPDMADAMRVLEALYRDIAAFVQMGGMAAKPAYAYSELLQRLFPLVKAKLSNRLTVMQLADELNVSQSTLAKRFRAEVEMPLGAYIDTMLFQKAQQLLLFTDDSIGAIADDLGFCDQFYFSRYFKNHQKQTPSQYRRASKLGG